MYHVMIVDDEMMARARIRMALGNGESEFVLDQEAVNGEDALARMRERVPDIVLVDMHMPVMNGVAFIRALKELHPHLPFAALSGYEDYEYVRDSLKLGAVDYILKSDLSHEVLLGVLEKCAEALRRASLEEQNGELARSHRESAERVYRREAVLKLLGGRRVDCEQLARACGLEVEGRSFQLILMHIDNMRQHETEEGKIAMVMLGSIIISISQEVISRHGSGLIESIDEGEYVLILPFEHVFSKQYVNDACRRLIIMLQQNLSKYTNLTASFAMGKGSCLVGEISESYRQARQTLSLSHLHGRNSFISSLAPSSEPQFVTLDGEHEKAVTEAVAQGNRKACREAIEQVFDRMIRQNADRSSCQVVCIELMNMLHHALEAIPLGEEMRDRAEQYKRRVLGEEYMDEAARLILSAYDELFDFMAEHQELRGCNPNTLRAVTYIRENYEGDISLAAVAQALHVNKSYLSRIFSSDCGTSLTEYAAMYRIEKAKQLLEAGVSIKDTARQVGIENTPYFFRMFKRYTGRTPQSYQ